MPLTVRNKQTKKLFPLEAAQKPNVGKEFGVCFLGGFSSGNTYRHGMLENQASSWKICTQKKDLTPGFPPLQPVSVFGRVLSIYSTSVCLFVPREFANSTLIFLLSICINRSFIFRLWIVGETRQDI